jgi:hypothetical protein
MDASIAPLILSVEEPEANRPYVMKALKKRRRETRESVGQMEKAIL